MPTEDGSRLCMEHHHALAMHSWIFFAVAADCKLLTTDHCVCLRVQEQDNEQQREGAGGEMKVEDAES